MLKRFWHKRQIRRTQASLPPNYEPGDDEEFMSPKQLAFFRGRLEQWREEILQEAEGTIASLKQDSKSQPDNFDRATREADRALELRERDRQRKLVVKIDQALDRIDRGAYGYCEETGQPIALRRLIARPIATLSIEAQERHEQEEKFYNQD